MVTFFIPATLKNNTIPNSCHRYYMIYLMSRTAINYIIYSSILYAVYTIPHYNMCCDRIRTEGYSKSLKGQYIARTINYDDDIMFLYTYETRPPRRNSVRLKGRIQNRRSVFRAVAADDNKHCLLCAIQRFALIEQSGAQFIIYYARRGHKSSPTSAHEGRRGRGQNAKWGAYINYQYCAENRMGKRFTSTDMKILLIKL